MWRQASRLPGGGAAVILSVLLSALTAVAQPQVPYLDAREHQTEYLGPGREAPAADVAELRVAYFGPGDADHPEWGDAWRGAVLALEEVNAAGGVNGTPLRLLPAWAENPWNAGVTALTRLVYGENVLAIVGGVDGVTTHLAEQVVVKARLPLLSPGNTDSSVNLTNVPWVLTCLPTDDAQAEVVGEALLEVVREGSYASVAGTDHDSRAAHAAFRTFLAGRGRSPVLRLDVEPGVPQVATLASRLAAAEPRAVLLLAPSRDAARVARALRDAGFTGTIFGGATLARRVFAAEAGPAAEGVVVPLLYEPGPTWDRFAARFEQRFGVALDYLAGQTYDAVCLLAAAACRSGQNRALLLDALRALSPWSGVTGGHVWDRTGRNPRALRLGVVRSGQVRQK